MIPKIIHYIWLGGNPLPKEYENYIEGWKKLCPDYEIKRHDETNLNIDINEYCRQAYDNKKWAFASDVLRYYVLFEEGGIYLDTDVELLKPLDCFLNEKLFLGFETMDYVAPGLIMGAEKGNKIVKDLLDEYKNRSFINNDGSLNLQTICKYSTNYLVNNGLVLNGKTQHFKTFSVYAIEIFNPTDFNGKVINMTPNTCSIHHYGASWVKKQSFIVRIFNKLKRIFKRKKK